MSIRFGSKAGSISLRLSAVKIVARVHFRGITAACVSITGEIIVAHPGMPTHLGYERRRHADPLRDPFKDRRDAAGM
jgi:hypothetical protein